ncbi:hypothetical protein SADUNF_Sadunf02G0183000 [Salix dunnii]|uniref:Late embryogenesis abundant protein LEA-2 subgroup domain-containing protein n=1 Tax=Salix dunnii TaxID=1413687 RepID=A0A835N8L2_9ROSI|nr:hypothetical protein SADUNF_Sadunf02G0183000 [Salix dunnii]
MARMRGFKICCSVTTIFTIVLVVIFTTLAFTVFKPNNPNVIATLLVSRTSIQFGGSPNVTTLNVTLGMVITIDNPNYGSFKFTNSAAYVKFHGVIVGEVPIQADLIPAHSKVNITTSVDLMADELIKNPYFLQDLTAGRFNFVSTSSLHGKVEVIKILKLHATALSTCDISLFVTSPRIKSSCNSQIKL